MHTFIHMKKLLFFSALGLVITLLGAAFIFRNTIEAEQENEDPSAPYDFFAQTRAYPDAVFDTKAFEDLMMSASAQNRNTAASTNGNWQIEGPTNIGGRITCMAVSPTNSNVILIGTPGAGIYKTTNGGTTWTPVFDSNPFLYVGAIAYDPSNPNTVYAGTGDPDVPFTVFVGDGIYKSTDGGNTWTNMGLANTKIINKIVVNPSNSNEVYVAALGNPIVADNNRGIYKTTNGGTTWTQVLQVDNQTGFTDIEINPSNPQVLYATSYTCIRNATVNIRYSNQARVYKTTNSGSTWNVLQGGLPNYKVNRYSICMSAQDPNKLYVAVSDSTYSMQKVLVTTNGGTSWTDLGNNGIASNYGNFGWYFSAIECDPSNDNDIYIGGVELFKSSDGGANWSLNMPPWWQYDVHADIHVIKMIAPGVYFLGTDGGLYLTNDDGATYSDVDNIPNTQFYRVEVNPFNSGIYWGGAQDNGTCWGNASSINSWWREFGGDGFQMRFDPTDAQTYYVEVQNGGLYATTDAGSTWNNNDNNIDPNDRRNWDMPYVLSNLNPNTQYTGTYRVYKNTAGPVDNWAPISPDLTDGIILDPRFHNISAIDHSNLNAQTIFVGTSDANVWVTTNDGGSWTNITGTLPNRYVTSVHASPNTLNNVYVTHTGYKYGEYIPHVHKSTNNGATWTDISGNLPQAGVNDILIVPGNENNIYVANDIGVYVTYDGGINWYRVGNNMPIVSVWDIAYNAITKRLIAGTYAKSLQTIDVTTLTTGLNDKVKNNADLLVYPTVADSEIHIKTPNYSRGATVRVIDFNGKTVKEFAIDNELTTVDVSGLNSGAYLVKLTTGEGSVVKRIIKN